MKYMDLQQRMKNRPFFRLEDLATHGRPAAHEKVQLSHWVKDGRLLRLKRGMYAFSAHYGGHRPEALELAEPLYRPSYLSLEYALSYYGLVPEAASTLTSVSTRKTARFSNPLGHFSYNHVQPAYFFGFHRQTVPVVHWLAEPEKALLDFLYLRLPGKQELTPELFAEGYRIQNLTQLNRLRFQSLLEKFNDRRVQVGGHVLLQMIPPKGKAHD